MTVHSYLQLAHRHAAHAAHAVQATAVHTWERLQPRMRRGAATCVRAIRSEFRDARRDVRRHAGAVERRGDVAPPGALALVRLAARILARDQLAEPPRAEAGVEVDDRRSAHRRQPLAEEVAHAILWLLSDEASYTTGSFMDVTGGR